MFHNQAPDQHKTFLFQTILLKSVRCIHSCSIPCQTLTGRIQASENQFFVQSRTVSHLSVWHAKKIQKTGCISEAQQRRYLISCTFIGSGRLSTANSCNLPIGILSEIHRRPEMNIPHHSAAGIRNSEISSPRFCPCTSAISGRCPQTLNPNFSFRCRVPSL